MRRVNQAIYLITQGAREHAFRSQKTIAEVLADEIINVEKSNLQSSYALKKKEEIEKVAKGNRWKMMLYNLFNQYVNYRVVLI